MMMMMIMMTTTTTTTTVTEPRRVEKYNVASVTIIFIVVWPMQTLPSTLASAGAQEWAC